MGSVHDVGSRLHNEPELERIADGLAHNLYAGDVLDDDKHRRPRRARRLMDTPNTGRRRTRNHAQLRAGNVLRRCRWSRRWYNVAVPARRAASHQHGSYDESADTARRPAHNVSVRRDPHIN